MDKGIEGYRWTHAEHHDGIGQGQVHNKHVGWGPQGLGLEINSLKFLCIKYLGFSWFVLKSLITIRLEKAP